MNDREIAFIARLVDDKNLAGNDYRMLLGMLIGRPTTRCGLPKTSMLRTRTKLRQEIKYIDKVDGKWVIRGEAVGLFQNQGAGAHAEKPAHAVPRADSNSHVGVPPQTPETMPLGVKPETEKPRHWVHPFLARPGAQIVAIVGVMELTGTGKEICNRIVELATTGAATPADLVEPLDRAETLAKKRFPG